jgi:hypothetical protein
MRLLDEVSRIDHGHQPGGRDKLHRDARLRREVGDLLAGLHEEESMRLKKSDL